MEFLYRNVPAPLGKHNTDWALLSMTWIWAPLLSCIWIAFELHLNYIWITFEFKSNLMETIGAHHTRNVNIFSKMLAPNVWKMTPDVQIPK